MRSLHVCEQCRSSGRVIRACNGLLLTRERSDNFLGAFLLFFPTLSLTL